MNDDRTNIIVSKQRPSRRHGTAESNATSSYLVTGTLSVVNTLQTVQRWIRRRGFQAAGPDLVAAERVNTRLAVLGAPDMTCRDADRLNWTCDHSRSQSSVARSPCR